MKTSTQQSATPAKKPSLLSQLRPILLVNVLFPFITYSLLSPRINPILAMVIACSLPAIVLVYGLITKNRLDPVGLLVICSLLLSSLAAFTFSNTRFLLSHSSLGSVLFGLASLVSFLLPKPLFFYLLRSFTASSAPGQTSQFDANWANPAFRTLCRRLTIGWGCAIIVSGVIQAFLAFTLSTNLVLPINQTLNALVMAGLFVLTITYIRHHSHISKDQQR